MKRQEIESIINPKEYNKHYYGEDGWRYLETITTSLEKIMKLCTINGLKKELNDLMTIPEVDYICRLYEVYQYIKEDKEMGKTYFRQLIDLYDTCSEAGGVVEILFEDALGRCSQWLFDHPHEEDGVCLENDSYIKRNYEFVKSLLNVE